MNKKTVLIIVAVLAVVFLFAGLFFIPFELSVIKQLYSYVSNEIVGITGLSHTLVQGVVLLLLSPLLWLIPILFKRKHKFNKVAWLGVLSYISVFFISLFLLSSKIYFRHDNKEILKWYALTPEGVKYYDTPGIDPVYSIKLKPVTPDVVKRLKLLEKGDFKSVDPEKLVWFNPITGEPQAWYHYSQTRGYEFYDKPGYDPMTGDPLIEVSKEVYELWIKAKNDTKGKTALLSAGINVGLQMDAGEKKKAESNNAKIKRQRSSIIKGEDW